MRVLEALSDTNIGGAGRLLLTRLANSDRDNIETAVLLPKGSMLLERFQAIGIKIFTIDGCKDKSFELSAVKKIVEVIKQFSPDVVNAHGCMSARIAACICRVPVRIYTRHCAFPTPRWMRAFPCRNISGAIGSVLSTDVIAVAEAARSNLLEMGIPDRKINVVINGVDGFERYSPDVRRKCREELGVEGGFVVGICARIERCKDHDCFLRAARVLSLKDEKYRFIIVGGGTLLAEMKELAKALGISDKVIFTGFTDDVERYFNCFDVNVNCSIGTETSSLALSEGMSIGLPCVASSFGGNPYMVRHGVNGYIYPAGDFCSLAERIEEIASDAALYARMSENAYLRFCNELNSRNMTETTEALYSRLLSMRSKKRIVDKI